MYEGVKPQSDPHAAMITAGSKRPKANIQLREKWKFCLTHNLAQHFTSSIITKVLFIDYDTFGNHS